MMIIPNYSVVLGVALGAAYPLLWGCCKFLWAGSSRPRLVQGFILPALLLVILVSAVFLPLSESFAQSRRECLAAEGADAIKICQQLVSKGSKNVDVHWHLASSLFEAKRNEDALSVVNSALQSYPQNPKLLSLRDHLSSSISENRSLQAAQKKNENRMKKSSLKITCLLKSGAEGLNACRQFLESSNDDRVRKRLAELEQQGTNTAATASATRTDQVSESATTTSQEESTAAKELPQNQTVQVETTQAETTQAETTQAETTQAEIDPQLVQFQETVRSVQGLLNQLGFDSGAPDGTPGAQTKTALAEFYRMTGLAERLDINAATLADLQSQQQLLEKAQSLLLQSRASADKGDLSLAMQQLTEARSSSRLMLIPEDFQQNLNRAMADSQKQTQTQTQTQTQEVQPLAVGKPPVSDELLELLEKARTFRAEHENQQQNAVNILSNLPVTVNQLFQSTAD